MRPRVGSNFQSNIPTTALVSIPSKGIAKLYNCEIRKNVDENIPYINKSLRFSNIRNRWIGHRGVVCGAGPSLDVNLEWIKKTKEEKGNMFKVVAVDLAILPLLSAGIYPDVICSVEFQEYSYYFLDLAIREFEYDTSNVLGYFSSGSCSKLVQAFKGDRVFFTPRVWQTLDDRLGRCRAHLSDNDCIVGFSAVKLADSLGFRDMFLAGMELHFSKLNVSSRYCKNTWHSLASKEDKKEVNDRVNSKGYRKSSLSHLVNDDGKLHPILTPSKEKSFTTLSYLRGAVVIKQYLKSYRSFRETKDLSNSLIGMDYLYLLQRYKTLNGEASSK